MRHFKLFSRYFQLFAVLVVEALILNDHSIDDHLRIAILALLLFAIVDAITDVQAAMKEFRGVKK